MEAQNNSVLTQVSEGMAAYSAEGYRVGTVEAVFVGKGTAYNINIFAIMDLLSEALGGQRDLPGSFFTRLYEEGFIRVNRGLLRRAALVFPQQVERVGEGGVYLKVESRELTKI